MVCTAAWPHRLASRDCCRPLALFRVSGSARRTRGVHGTPSDGRGEESEVFYWVVKAILTPLLRVLYRPWTEGLENIPETGPAILASNHLSFLDSIFMPLMVPRRVTFLAKSDYFTEPGSRAGSSGCSSPVSVRCRSTAAAGRASEAALTDRHRHPQRGQAAGDLPGGHPLADGRLYRGKVGVARMALEAGVPGDPGRDDRHLRGAAAGQGRAAHQAGRHPVRQAAGLQPLRRPGGRPVRPAQHDRRDHVRAHVAFQPGVRRHLRGEGQGGSRRRARKASASVERAERSAA